MRYTVIATLEAQAGIRESFKYIYERAPLNAARWLQGVWDKINTLERLPERCPRAREAEHLKRNLRQLLYKSHRIVFSIDKQKQVVYVLHVRHSKRRAAGESAEQSTEE